MMKILRPLLVSSLGLLVILAVGCANQAANTRGESEPSLSAGSSDRGSPAPTAIPVSAELVLEYAEAQRSINAEWDSLHADFDQWRSSINACDRAAAETALRTFASDFGEITRQARNLPGKGIARDLPSDVIAAAASEEASLRSLRDNWNPANTTLLEETQTSRAKAADVLRSTRIAMDKLEEMDDPGDRQVAEDFAEELAPVEAAWDDFYDSYAALEDEHLELEANDIVERLRGLVGEHEDLAKALGKLPSDKVTDPVQDPLIDAMDAEAKALGDLLDTMRKAARAEASKKDDSAADTAKEADAAEPQDTTEDMNGSEATEDDAGEQGSDGQEEGAGEQGGDSDPDGRPEPGNIAGQASQGLQDRIARTVHDPVHGPDTHPAGQQYSPRFSGSEDKEGEEPPDYSKHFDTFEEALESSRAVRKKAARDLDALVEGLSESDRKALETLVVAFGELMDSWDGFHTAFDGWVRTGGHCDRAGAAAALQHFNQQFAGIRSQVRGLSQVSYLRPSSDLLSEAVDREGAALRGLANTWAPYESDVYRGMDEERANAEKLRRLGDRRVQELLERNGIDMSQ